MWEIEKGPTCMCSTFNKELVREEVSSDYTVTTIYDKDREIILENKLSISYQVQKNWGSINIALNGSHYFHDLSQFNVRLYNNINLKITKGLSLNMRMNVSIIRDQINLPAGEVSDEDILLQRQALATGYSLWGDVGINYTSGSIYNSVVNPRFN